MKLLEAIQRVTTNMPDVLTMDEAIYVRKRKFNADSMAKIAPADDKDDLNERGWRLLDYVMFVQQRADEGVTPHDQVLRLMFCGLREDEDRREILKQVITAPLAAATFNISYDAVNDACQQGHIFAMKAAGTWLMLREDAEARWGKK